MNYDLASKHIKAACQKIQAEPDCQDREANLFLACIAMTVKAADGMLTTEWYSALDGIYKAFIEVAE